MACGQRSKAQLHHPVLGSHSRHHLLPCIFCEGCKNAYFLGDAHIQSFNIAQNSYFWAAAKLSAWKRVLWNFANTCIPSKITIRSSSPKPTSYFILAGVILRFSCHFCTMICQTQSIYSVVPEQAICWRINISPFCRLQTVASWLLQCCFWKPLHSSRSLIYFNSPEDDGTAQYLQAWLYICYSLNQLPLHIQTRSSSSWHSHICPYFWTLLVRHQDICLQGRSVP